MRKGFLLFLPWLVIWSQDLPSQSTLLDNIMKQYNEIQDYSVRVTMSVTMPGFRMPRKKIDIYYKNPGKIKIESDGFAIVPKAGITMSPELFLSHLDNMEITADPKGGILITGEAVADSLPDILAGRGPEADSRPLALFIHVNSEHWFIDDVSARLDTTTVFQITSEYAEVATAIWMPVTTTMTLSMTADMTTDMPERAARKMGGGGNQPFTGNIVIRYSKYKINRGIKDSFFNETDAVF